MRVTLADADVVDGTGYTPYAGRTVRGWPAMVVRRGEVIVEEGRCLGAPGSGRFLPRVAGRAAEPTGRRQPEWLPAASFGAVLE